MSSLVPHTIRFMSTDTEEIEMITTAQGTFVATTNVSGHATSIVSVQQKNSQNVAISCFFVNIECVNAQFGQSLQIQYDTETKQGVAIH